MTRAPFPTRGSGHTRRVALSPTGGAAYRVVTNSRLWGWEVEEERLPLHQMRASDAERDLTVDHLTTAFVEGRLDHEEYDRRVGLALSAVLVGELELLTADLPRPAEAGRPRRETTHTARGSPHDPRSAEGDVPALPLPWREWGDEWRWWLGVAVLLTTVWGVVSLVGGEIVPYWPLVPLGIWGAVLLASAIWPDEGEPP